MKLTIQKGDNLELLKQYPDNYFDSVVTDSPYGLGAEPDAAKLLQDWIAHGYHEIKGRGFMNKKWDAFVPQPALWKEVYRVLKPGGHLLSFFGTRTYDWGVLAIRLAGFEVRDMITWHYGEGFPKSLNVANSIEAKIKTGSANKKEFQNLNGDKKKRGDWGISKMSFEQGFRSEDYSAADKDRTVRVEYETEEAKVYEGWGSALKPATEPIILARKPLIGSIADNILSLGTGGINIDDCRIEFVNEKDLASATYGTGSNILGGNYVGSNLTDGRKNIEADLKPFIKPRSPIVSRAKQSIEHKQQKSELDQFYDQMALVMPNVCDNCGAKLNAFNKFARRSVSCHLLPKSKFESIACNPLNIVYMGASFIGSECDCHTQFDYSVDKRIAMPIYKTALERFEILKHEIPSEVLKAAYSYLNITWS